MCVCVAVSLDNVLLDVRELQRGMDLTKREYQMHGTNTLLRDFIALNEGKLKKLQEDAKVAQVRSIRTSGGVYIKVFGLKSEAIVQRHTFIEVSRHFHEKLAQGIPLSF